MSVKPKSEADNVLYAEMERMLTYIRDEATVPRAFKSTSDSIITFLHTALRQHIRSVLIPVLYRLRTRIRTGDPGYFASDAFIKSVGAAVKERCAELVDSGEFQEGTSEKISPILGQILDCVNIVARAHQQGDVAGFEFLIERLRNILDDIVATK